MKHPTVRCARALIMPFLATALALAGSASAQSAAPGAPPLPTPRKSAPTSPISQLPAGNYDYLDSGIVLKNGDLLTQKILGPLPPGEPKPSAEPRDFDGTWVADQSLVYRTLRDMDGFKLPYTAAARRILEARVKATYKDGTPYANASAECLPMGPHWQYYINSPFQLYQDKRSVVLVFQEYHGLWNIRMNQPHRPSNERFYMGDSVGHWDGDTLVVDTTNFKIRTWIDVDGTPASKDAHLVFRIRKVDDNGPKLRITMTVDDPAMYTHPWSIVNTFAWRPDRNIFSEYNCEQQVGVPGGVAAYGLIPEPPEE